ncbi:MAG TPA: PCRF domain-containing protein, partial [Candidatus Ozemobacteraceae bacterium]|nr:PCRF domain-containing protein [Candidatus Ozemobacteraceae bacterium]
MLHKLESMNLLFQQLTEKLSDPALINNQPEYQKTAKRRAELEPLHRAFTEYQELLTRKKGSEEILATETDPELKGMAEEEVKTLQPEIERLEKQLRFMLIPKDAQDSCNTIVEIRAGTGGEEAALFAAELFRMYT